MRTYGRAHRDGFALAGALAVPLILAVVLLPWRSSLPDTDTALVLVVGVVAVAANGPGGAGVLAAACSAVWFDFFWTVPYERFTITRGADIGTTVLLLLVGAAVSELAARGRRVRRIARADNAYLAAIGSTAGLAAAGAEPAAVIDQVAAQLTAILALRSARFEQGVFLGRPPRLDEHGRLVWGSAVWDLSKHGWPDEQIELRARNRGRVHGRFLLSPEPGAAPSPEARQVAVVLADQVGAALAAHPSAQR